LHPTGWRSERGPGASVGRGQHLGQSPRVSSAATASSGEVQPWPHGTATIADATPVEYGRDHGDRCDDFVGEQLAADAVRADKVVQQVQSPVAVERTGAEGDSSSSLRCG